MIALSNSTAQTLAVGESMTFDIIINKLNNTECFIKNTQSVKLICNGLYEVHFSGSVAIPTGGTAGTAIQLSIELSGNILNYSNIISTPGALEVFNNVAKTIPVNNCCCDFDRVTITNTGTQSLTIDANSILYIHKVY